VVLQEQAVLRELQELAVLQELAEVQEQVVLQELAEHLVMKVTTGQIVEDGSMKEQALMQTLERTTLLQTIQV